MEAKDLRGNPSPIREEVKEEEDEGAPSPLLFRWRRNAAVAIIIITAIYTNTSAIFTNISIKIGRASCRERV